MTSLLAHAYLSPLVPVFYVCLLPASTNSPYGVSRHCLYNMMDLFQACKSGRVQHLEHLMFYGADFNQQNSSGNTPLHVCAANNQVSPTFCFPNPRSVFHAAVLACMLSRMQRDYSAIVFIHSRNPAPVSCYSEGQTKLSRITPIKMPINWLSYQGTTNLQTSLRTSALMKWVSIRHRCPSSLSFPQMPLGICTCCAAQCLAFINYSSSPGSWQLFLISGISSVLQCHSKKCQSITTNVAQPSQLQR